MSLVNSDYPGVLMRQHNSKFWVISDYTGKNTLAENWDTTKALETCIQDFNTALANITGEFVLVKIRSKTGVEAGKGGAQKGNFDLQVRCVKGGPVATMGSPSSNGMPSWRDLLDMQKEVTALQIEKIRAEMTSAKPSAAETLAAALVNNNRLMDGLVGLVEKAVGLPPAPALSAASRERLAQPSAPQLVQNDLDRLQKVLPQDLPADHALHALANYLEANPDQVPMVLGVIFPQQ